MSLSQDYHRIRFLLTINWVKTLYFNYKVFPFAIAKKLPVYFYGRVKLAYIKGEVSIDAPIKTGMIGFGQAYEMQTVGRGTSELNIAGKVKFKGHVQFGKDYFFYVAKDGYCELGHMSSMASNGKLICTNKVTLGTFARIGSESQIVDTNFHQMLNTQTGEKYPMTAPIKIGNHNFIGKRVSIMSKTNTPNRCTIASNSVCNKDYTAFGENILIGGIPAKLLKENISRDWDGEHDMIMKALIIQ